MHFLSEGSHPANAGAVDIFTLQAELHRHPSVDACALSWRTPSAPAEAVESSSLVVAYVVPTPSAAAEELPQELGDWLRRRLPPGPGIAVVPVPSLPYNEAGAPDLEALHRLPAIDGSLLRQRKESLDARPEVCRSAAVLRRRETPLEHLHLRALQPHRLDRGLTTGSVNTDDSSTPTTPDRRAPTPEPGSLPLAISRGADVDLRVPDHLVQALERAAEADLPGSMTYICEQGRVDASCYGELLDAARRIAAGLRERGVRPGDGLLVALGTARAQLETFWGAMVAGAVPAIAPLPRSQNIQSRDQQLLRRTWEALDKPALVIDSAPDWLDAGAAVFAFESLRNHDEEDRRDLAPAYRPDADQTAFYSLTSGSTGTPKCIMLSHRSLLTRAAAVNLHCRPKDNEVFLNWMPLDHIGGLSDFQLRALLLARPQVHVAKEYVLAQPLRWLDLISRFRATRSWAPNFAYRLVNEGVAELQAAGKTPSWDLGSVQTLLTAGEAVSAEVCRRFVDQLAPYGLPRTCLQPAFGMAETGSGTTYHLGSTQGSLQVFQVDRDAMDGWLRPEVYDPVGKDPDHPASSDEAPTSPDADQDRLTFVGLGRPIPGVTVRIVDPDGRVLPEEHVGRLQFHGTPVASGYLNRPDANAVVFRDDGWMESGDLAFLSDGCLAVTGRNKATLIINGANFYSAEIEDLVQRIDGVAPSLVAACAVRAPTLGVDDGAQSEVPAIFFHPQAGNGAHLDDRELLRLSAEIRQTLNRELGFNPAFVVPVDADEIAKTQIGKIQHRLLVERFAAGEFQDRVERLDLLERNERTLPQWFLAEDWQRRRLGSEDPTSGSALGATDKSSHDGVVVFGEPGPLLDALCDRLGHRLVARVAPGTEFRALPDRRFELRPGRVEDYRRLMPALSEAANGPRQVIHLWNAGVQGEATCQQDMEHGLELGVYALTALVQAIHAADAGGDSGISRLLVVTRGARAVEPDDAVDPARAHLAGWIKSLAQEQPHRRPGLLDLPLADAEAPAEGVTAERILAELNEAEPDVAWRKDQRWIQRLRRLPLPALGSSPSTAVDEGIAPPFRDQGTYLIHGELKGMGLALAQTLVTRYHARLLLPGVTAWDQLPLALRQAVTAVKSVPRPILGPVDLLRFDRLQAWLGESPLDGVIHLARVPEIRTVLEETRQSLAETLEPEVVAVWNLHRLLAERSGAEVGGEPGWLRPGIFLCMSSVTGALGGATVGAIAAASSFHSGLGTLQNQTKAIHAYVRSWSLWTDLVGHLPEAMVDSSRALGYFPIQTPQGMASLAALGWDRRIQPLIGLDPLNRRLRSRLTDTPEPLLEPIAVYTPAGERPLDADALVGDAPSRDAFGTPVPWRLEALREPDSVVDPKAVELWPSVAEFYVYDDLLYHILTHDERRNHSYHVAIKRLVRDRLVVEVGTGKDAILARFCARAGARKVYAIELDEQAYTSAKNRVNELGLGHKIEVIHGDSTQVQLPELADVCVSEIVGPIGGCEGAAVLINDAHRFLKPDGVMLPIRSVTRIAAVGLPRELMTTPRFNDTPAGYVDKIFQQVGRPFDLRLCVKNTTYDDLLSTYDVFEDLDYSAQVPLEHEHEIRLDFESDGQCDGFLVWLTLHTVTDEVIDTLAHEYAWLPVFMPVFDPPLNVSAGDHLTATVERTLCGNGLNPDFTVRGQVHRVGHDPVDFEHRSLHFEAPHKGSPFYRRLFAEDDSGRALKPRQAPWVRRLPALPITGQSHDGLGRIDHARLRRSASEDKGTGRSGSDLERQLAGIWQQVLGVSDVGLDDNFFELGGHSLLLVQVHAALQEQLDASLSLVELFEYPTIAGLSDYLQAEDEGSDTETPWLEPRTSDSKSAAQGSGDIAVVGMACRFPGANDPDTFWQNLRNGIESISFFTDADVAAAGIDPRSAEHPDYVKASPLIDGVQMFDAELFGISPREAELMDPQQRLFLEVCWEAMERAGYNPLEHDVPVGMFAGASMNTYLMNQIFPHRDGLDSQDDLAVMTLDSMGGFQVMVSSDKDYLPTQTSYRLNLTGPSINVQTACSTTLVTVHLACQSLLLGETDMCIAGGSSVQVPETAGHLYQEGMITSPDGHCRAFDARAGGTVFGSGVGAVVLKRLEDALADGDVIHAVVKGSAVNNDGGVKMGYMAPSSDGQSGAVAGAFRRAGVRPDSLSMVEAHGTGTELGDPIEVAGMTKVFRSDTDRTSYCALGSVKTNVGHLQIASGVVGFMKTVLALEHGEIPPSLHYENPNPKIDFESTPFFVNSRLRPFPDTLRRAGVSSLGIGGTNAFAVLEQPPERPVDTPEVERQGHPLVLSAHNPEALDELARRYLSHLKADPLGVHTEDRSSVADLCFTANTGRVQFDHRLGLWGADEGALADALEAFLDSTGAVETTAAFHRGEANRAPKVVFLFPGQGSQYAAMAGELYREQPTFRASLDRSAHILEDLGDEGLDVPLIDLLLGDDERLTETRYTQPALFAVAAALADLWRSWGVEPAAVMGHSLGEYVAAYVAGVFSLEDGLRLVAGRARLMGSLPAGSGMVSVFAPLARVQGVLADHGDRVSLAADNKPTQVVISGDLDALAEITAELDAAGIRHRALKVSHGFHSPAVDAIRPALEELVASLSLSAPSLPLISNLDGLPVGDEITQPAYWGRHLRQPVRFRDGIRTLYRQGLQCFLEVGPGNSQLGMTAECLPPDDGLRLLPSLPSAQAHGQHGDWPTLLSSLTQLWVLGCDVDWRAFDAPYPRRRRVLPTYPFQRRRHWFEGDPQAPANATRTPQAGASNDQLHPLLHRRSSLPSLGVTVFETRLRVHDLDWLRDHTVYDQVVVAGACHVTMALRAGQDVADGPLELSDVVFAQALVVPDDGVSVQLVLHPDGDGHRFELLSLGEEDMGHAGKDRFTVHASGRLLPIDPSDHGPAGDEPETPERILRRCGQTLDGDDFFALQRTRGIELGPSYRWMQAMQRGPGEAICAIDGPMVGAELHGLSLHPGLLDTCFGTLIAAGRMRPDETLVPFAMEAVRLLGTPRPARQKLWAHARLRQEDGERLFGDVRLINAEGRAVVELIGLDARPVDRAAMLRGLAADDSQWLYQPVWTAEPAPEESVTEDLSDQTWMLLGRESDSLTDRLANALRSRGARVWMVIPGERFEGHVKDSAGDDKVTVHAERPEDFATLVTTVNKAAPITHVVHLWGLNEAPETAPVSNLVGAHCGLLHLVQALAELPAHASPSLALLSRGAQPVDPGATVDPVQGSLWGMAWAVAEEHPELSIRCLDLDPEAAGQEPLDAVLDELVRDHADAGRVAWRGGQRYTQELVQAPPGTLGEPWTLRADRSYLITGGLGALGLEVAESLVRQGARQLILASRSAPDGPSESRLQALRDAGARVTTASLDLRQADAVAHFIQEHRDDLAGVLHCAGVLDDGLLRDTDRSRVENVLAAKALGAWHLHRATEALQLDVFVLFSSAASLLGNAGQGAYAAANGFLDGLAHHRRALGLPALSLNWGPWSVGMAAQAHARRRLAEQGFLTLEPERAARLLARLAGTNASQVGVLGCAWNTLAKLKPGRGFARYLRRLAPQGVEPETQGGNAGETGEAESFRRRFDAADSALRLDLLRDLVTRLVTEIAGVRNPEPDRPLMEQGFDSLMSVRLQRRLVDSLEHHLPVSLLYSRPTVDALARFLADDMAPTVEPDADPSSHDQDSTLDSTLGLDLDLGSSAATDDALKQVDQMTAQELELLIAEEIAQD